MPPTDLPTAETPIYGTSLLLRSLRACQQIACMAETLEAYQARYAIDWDAERRNIEQERRLRAEMPAVPEPSTLAQVVRYHYLTSAPFRKACDDDPRLFPELLLFPELGISLPPVKQPPAPPAEPPLRTLLL